MKFIAFYTDMAYDYTDCYFTHEVEEGVEVRGWHYDMGRAKRFNSKQEAIDFIGDAKCGEYEVGYTVVQVPDITKEDLIAKTRELLIQKRDDYYALVPAFVVTGFDEKGHKYQIDSRSGQLQHVIVSNDMECDEYGRSFSILTSLGKIYCGAVAVDQVEKILENLSKTTNITIKFMEQCGWNNYSNCAKYKEVSRLVQDEGCVVFTFEGLVEALDHKFTSDRKFFDVNFYNGELQVEINWGDWKHDHGYAEHVVEKFMAERGVLVHLTGSETTDENGSDTYSAVHTFAEVK